MSFSKRVIAVLGVTGTQGSSVAAHFLTHKDWAVRGITRDPTTDKAKAWARQGVEMVQADQNDIDSLRKAFRGAHAIFAVTDFASNYNKVIAASHLREKAASLGKSVGELAADMEYEQGVNIAKAAADTEGLSKYVFSTLAPVKTISGGKYTHAWEFDSKAAVVDYIRQHLPGLPLSTVTMGIYMETWKDIPAFAPKKEPDGSFSFVRLKWPGIQAHPQVIASKDTGAFVSALVHRYPPDTHVLGASEIVTAEEYAATWGRVMGARATVKDLSEEDYTQYLPEDIKDTMLDLFKFFPEYGYAGGNSNVKTPAELGIATTPLEDWIQGEDWSLVMKDNQ